jgi:hypothetical protein
VDIVGIMGGVGDANDMGGAGITVDAEDKTV